MSNPLRSTPLTSAARGQLDDPGPSLLMCPILAWTDRRTVQHGLCRFLHLPDSSLRPVAWIRCLRDRHPRRRSLSRRHVPGDPYRRFDGPVRHAQSHVVLCVDGDGFDAPVSADAVVLALLLLQLINGAAVSFAWSGVQTLIAQLT